MESDNNMIKYNENFLVIFCGEALQILRRLVLKVTLALLPKFFAPTTNKPYLCALKNRHLLSFIQHNLKAIHALL